MSNLRHMGTGQKLIQDVLLKSGSPVKQIVRQVDKKVQKVSKKLPNRPSKFSAQP